MFENAGVREPVVVERNLRLRRSEILLRESEVAFDDYGEGPAQKYINYVLPTLLEEQFEKALRGKLEMLQPCVSGCPPPGEFEMEYTNQYQNDPEESTEEPMRWPR